MRYVIWIASALLAFVCHASEINLGTVAKFLVKVSIARKEELTPYERTVLILHRVNNDGFLRYGECEMRLTKDLVVQPIVETDDKMFRTRIVVQTAYMIICIDLKVNGFPNSIEIIDVDEKLIKNISEQIELALAEPVGPLFPSRISPENNRVRRLSRELSKETVLEAVTPPPKQLDVPTRTGLVKSLSLKMANPTMVKNTEKEETNSPPKSVRTTEDFTGKLKNFKNQRPSFRPNEKEDTNSPPKSVRATEDFTGKLETFKKQRPSHKPLDGAANRSPPKEIPLASVRKAENFSDRKATFERTNSRGKMTTEPVQFNEKALMMAFKKAESRKLNRTFSTEAVQAFRQKQAQEAMNPPKETTTKDSASIASKPDKTLKDDEPSLENMFNDALKEQDEALQRKAPERKPIVRERKNSGSASPKRADPRTVPRRKLNLSGLFQSRNTGYERDKLEGIGKDELEARRRLFATKKVENQELDGKAGLSKRNSSLFKEFRKQRPTISERHPFTSKYSPSMATGLASGWRESADNSDEDAENFDAIQLCLPEITSVEHFTKLISAAAQSGKKLDPNISDLIGKQYRVTLSVLERMIHFNGIQYHDLSGSQDLDQQISLYLWEGQDTVELIEKRHGDAEPEKKVMYQIFLSGQFNDLTSDRIIECLPASVAYSLVANKKKDQYNPFKFTPDDSAIMISNESELERVYDWIESELALPAWFGLKARFEDDSAIEFGQSFTIGLELSDDIADSHSNQIIDILALQYKKTLLNAVYCKCDEVVLVLPLQFNIVKLAQESIEMAISSTPSVPHDMVIHIPMID